MKAKIVLLLGVFSILLFFLFRGDNIEQAKSVLIKGGSFIEGLKIIQRKEDANTWILTAQRADIFEAENKAKLSDVSMIIDAKGMKIHAAEGLYDMLGKSLKLHGKVVADTKDYTIVADSVEWTSSGEIRTDGDVTVDSKKFTVKGVGMEADSGQKVKIRKNVKAIFYR